jgi:hypothetical protein
MYNGGHPWISEDNLPMMPRRGALCCFSAVFAVALAASVYTTGQTRGGPVDPGVRSGQPGAGGQLTGLTADEAAFFQDGQGRFAEVESVTNGANNGLGPRFNSNQCLSCHSQPNAGGSSPARNPQLEIATLNGAKNTVPWFIAQNGPIREARFRKGANGANDGEVHDLFVSPDERTPRAATSRSRTFSLPEIRSRAAAGTGTSSSASRLPCLARG